MGPFSRLRTAVYVGVAAIAVVLPAMAEAQALPPPAYIARVDGEVTLEHEGQAEPAAVNVPLVGGDRLFTANGRAVIMFPDGTSLEVVENSEVDFDSPTRYRVTAGSVDKQPLVRSQQASPYLPETLQAYAPSLDAAGAWEYDEAYGYVWYPTVAADWRPYYDGYWSDLRPYGWTWIGVDRWSWPTHHYGRWGYGHNRWFWVPGRSWGPAYVSWGVATDFVSWCPLGPNNAPLFSLSYGPGRSWSGWTFVPRAGFGSRGYYASRNAVHPSHIARTTPFIQERILSVARPRASARTLRAAAPAAAVPAAARTAAPNRQPAARGGAAAPQNYPLMGDFRRPPPAAPDYRRPIQAARPPAVAPRAPAADRSAPVEARPATGTAPPPTGSAPPTTPGREDSPGHVGRAPADTAHARPATGQPPPAPAPPQAPPAQAMPAPPARPGSPSAAPRGGHAAPAAGHSPNAGRSGRGG